MHFFSRYSYIWRFNPAKEKAYWDFNSSSNILSLQLINIMAMLGMALFIVVDFFRQVHYLPVFSLRFTTFIGSLIIFLYSRKHRTAAIDVLILTNCALLVAFAFVTTYVGNMPSFFLPNISVTILICVSVISGLRFRHSVMFNGLYLLLFFSYSESISHDPFYRTQYANIFLTFMFSTIASVVLENRKRRNFLQYEDLMRQKKQIEELNQQKSKIISLLSHDVASPIHSLSGLLHLQETGKVKEEEIKPFIRDVRKRLDSVSTMVYGLVRWSRSQLEGFIPEKKIIDLSNLLEEIVELFRPAAADKSIQIKVDQTSSLMIYSDEEMIRIALRNIVSNAVKFSKEKGTVTIRAFRENENIKVQVKNSSLPLENDTVRKLFSYQVTSSDGTSGEKGTGLGLAMASYFVKSNGGKIFFEGYDESSEEATFTIELPMGRNTK